jgi:cell shape-determining protein MreD
MSGIGWVLQVLALVIVGSAFVLGLMYDQIRLELAVAAGGGLLFLLGRWLQSRESH